MAQSTGHFARYEAHDGESIDRFVDEALKNKGLIANSRADKRTLIRRALLRPDRPAAGRERVRGGFRRSSRRLALPAGLESPSRLAAFRREVGTATGSTWLAMVKTISAAPR